MLSNGQAIETQLTLGMGGPGRPLRLRYRSRLRGGGRRRLPDQTSETSLRLRDEDGELQTNICYTKKCCGRRFTKFC